MNIENLKGADYFLKEFNSKQLAYANELLHRCEDGECECGDFETDDCAFMCEAYRLLGGSSEPKDFVEYVKECVQ
jgi:hypothetical protein